MTFSYRFLFIIFLAVILCSACKKPQRNLAFTRQGGIEADAGRQSQKDFDQSLELLQSLENAPCLPGTPGAEKLVQTADRLNKWMQNQKNDELWKADEELAAMELAVKQAAETAQDISRSLALLQKEQSTQLDAERKKITERLTQLVQQTRTVSQRCGIPSIIPYAQQVEELQKKFVALEKIPNLNDTAIRAFAKQLEKETRDFSGFAELFRKYSEELRIDGQFFHLSDVEYLKQSIWLRNTSRWARGDKQLLLDVAAHLFDWTVCNIDYRDTMNVPVSENQMLRMPQMFPWQSMLLGASTLWDRTWVFVELLRQQRIDAALLAAPHPEDPSVEMYWAVGVLLDGELYLFLPALGMPLPAHGGMSIADNGELSFQKIATFSQALKDDAILRQLDFSETEKFPLTSELLKNTTFHLPAVPESAALRMKIMELEMTGEQSTVLYTNIQEQKRIFREFAAKALANPEFDRTPIWKYPFLVKFEQLAMGTNTNLLMDAFTRPHPKRGNFPLWTGRVLYLNGRVSGQESAVTEFQNARISDRDISEYRNAPEFRNNPMAEMLLRDVSQSATLWLGVASFEMNSIPAAADFLNTLKEPRTALPEYILGRIAERQGKYAEAVKHYERTAGTISGEGNKLRAAWLKKLKP